MDELKPCPFCGGPATVLCMEYGDQHEGQTVWGVFCENDISAEYQHGHFIDNYATKEEAVNAWNKRGEG